MIRTDAQKQLWMTNDLRKVLEDDDHSDRGVVIRRIATLMLAVSTALKLSHLS